MKYSLRDIFLVKESKEESVELNGTELTVYHLTSKDKLNVPVRSYSNIEKPKPSGDKAKDIINNMAYNKHSVRSGQSIPDDIIEYQGITSILSDPFTQGTGFSPGGGDMYGKGLYTCYKFNPLIVGRYGDICLKFKFDISSSVIFFEDLAKKVHGKNWRIFDQIKSILSNKTNGEYSPESEEMIDSIMQAIISSRGSKTINKLSNLRNKSYLNDNDITSGPALLFSKILIELGLLDVINGLIFRGGRDGPVCLIYNPERDANFVGLGRASNGKVTWSNSLAEFFNNPKFLDISFEDMQEIAKENSIDDDEYKVDIIGIGKKMKTLEMLKDKTLQPDVLEKIYNEFNDETIKQRVLLHANASPDFLYNAAYEEQDTETLPFIFANKNFPFERLKQDVINGNDINEDMLDLLLGRPRVMDEPLARAIYKNKSYIIRSRAVNWKNLPTDMVIEMLDDPNEYIRGRAAAHKNAPKTVASSVKGESALLKDYIKMMLL